MTASKFTATSIQRAADMHNAGVKWAALEAEFGGGIVLAVKRLEQPAKICKTCDMRNSLRVNFCCKCGFLI